MMTTAGKGLRYLGYTAQVVYSDEDECFVGRIAGVRAVTGFHADSVVGLRQAFHEAVEHFIAVAKERGEEPEQPFTGRVMLRLPSQLHARVNASAQRAGLSVNQWAARALEQAL